MKLSQASLSLLTPGMALISVGVLFGNMTLLYLGTLPVVFLVLVLAVGETMEFTIEPIAGAMDMVVGDLIEVERRVTVRGGAGLITLREELPEHFRLVSGSNVRLALKGPGNMSLRLVYGVECTRRGVYHFDRLSFQVRHILGMLEPKTGSLALDQLVTVRPRLALLRRIRMRRQTSLLPAPTESHIRMGVDTTEFRDMRRYGSSDPYSKINWKATSRAMTSSGLLPIVNEYEKEGRSVVQIFLNCGSSMAAGSSLQNGFEYGVQAALSITQYYVDNQGVVGFSLYNEDTPFITRTNISANLKSIYQAKGPNIMADMLPNTPSPAVVQQAAALDLVGARRFSVYPDSGRKQLLKIRTILQEAEPGSTTYNLAQSFQIAQGNLRSSRPLLIFITNIQPSNAQIMSEDLIHILQRYGRARDRRRRLILLNISCLGLSSKSREDELAARVARIQETKLLRDSFGDFARVVNWDPTRGGLVESLSAGGLA